MSLSQDFINKYHIRKNVGLSTTNWFRVGGNAKYLYKPENTHELAEFLANLPIDMPVTVLGVGSNIIIRDSGIDGVVIKLGKFFTNCNINNSNSTIEAGAAMLDLNLAMLAAENSIAGLEFLSGIPGTIGGAVKMNAGAYHADISQILLSAEIVERNGKIRELQASELGFSYRKSAVPDDAIITKAVFQGRVGQKAEILEKINEIKKSREETQPIKSRTGGSTFKNPEGKKAWELIDFSGCRGLRQGDAQISEKHCNFMINTGNATATDLENLGEEVRQKVFAKTGIMLEWEIKRLGKSHLVL